MITPPPKSFVADVANLGTVVKQNWINVGIEIARKKVNYGTFYDKSSVD
jgi:hypothetical protein